MTTGRTACSILDDMRKAYETRNFSYMLALIEEMQFAANRMESALGDFNEYMNFVNYFAEIKQEVLDLYKVYVTKCKELGVTPEKRQRWIGKRFDLVDKKHSGDKFFNKNKTKDEDE